MRPLQRHAARMILTKVLVEDGLEGETLPADMAVKGFVSRVFADMVLQLILASILFATHTANKGCDAHVEPHVPVQATLLIEGFGAIDASETRVVAKPPLRYFLFTEIFNIATHSNYSRLLHLERNITDKQ